ncbi:RibD family protein [Thauera sp.]|uniref:RibD family protein n=1 Tax=Thauera sp. TaxID=1905334 RepID=UPI0039E4A195
MDRPKIICHMETSLNAKIRGPYMSSPARYDLVKNYEDTHMSFGCQAWLAGRVTMEFFAGEEPPVFDPAAPTCPREDWVAPTELKDFIVVVDPSGKLAWKQNSITLGEYGPLGKYRYRPTGHIIELLSERASDQYVSYLRQQGISYIFAGTDQLDLELAMRKLKSLFGVETMVLGGGAIVNGGFFNAGLVDELSLVIAPVLDDAIGTPTFSERGEHMPPQPPVGFSLIEVKTLPGDNVWLRYARRSHDDFYQQEEQ